MTENFQKIVFNKILENSSILVNKMEMNFKDLTPAGKAATINISAAITLNLIFTDKNYGSFNINLLYEQLSDEIENRKDRKSTNNVILFNEAFYEEQLNLSNTIFNNSKINASIIKKEIDSFILENLLNFTNSLHNYNNPSDTRPFFLFNTFISLFIYPFVNSSQENDKLIKDFRENLKLNRSFLELEGEFNVLINNLIAELMNNHTYDASFFNSLKEFKANSTANNKVNNKSPENNKNCYVATLVYEDINHPNVEFLRNYRDEKLLTNYLGKIFIKLYYNISPQLVIVLKPHKKIHKIIKYALDKFILTLTSFKQTK